MMRCCISLLVLAVVCAGAVMAQRERHANPTDFDFIDEGDWGDWDGVMTGRIIDPDGRPIPFARVQVHSKDIRTRTDDNGFFTVRGLQRGGHYSLIVGKRGFDGAVLRWIPIPSQQTADIGDYHLEYALPSTNFWQVSSNLVAGVWLVSSNFYDIIEGETNVYGSATWQRSFTDEGRIGKMATYDLVGDAIMVTSETAFVPPTPLSPPVSPAPPAPAVTNATDNGLPSVTNLAPATASTNSPAPQL
jgi:hypothetical protein